MKKTEVKIGDTRLVKGQEYICKGFSSSGSPIWRKNGEKQEETLEKGYQVGDEKDFNGRTYYCAELNAKGKPKWRLKDKKGGSKSDKGGSKQAAAQKQEQQGGSAAASTKQDEKAPQKKLEEMNPSELVDYAKHASTDALTKLVNDDKADKSLRQLAFNELKTRDDYDKTKVKSQDLQGGYFAKPTPKIQYKTKKPEVEIDSDEFKDYEVPTPQGRKKVVITTFRKFLTTKTDDDLLKTLNNTSAKADAIKRHLAYEEAMARGIPEDKIDVRGSLTNLWRKYKTEKDLQDYKNREFNEDEAMPLSYDWKGLDHEKIMHEIFEDGTDPAWLDEKSDIVRKTFKTETLSGRQRYDTFKDYYQRDPNLVPGYLTAQNKVNELYGQMWNWAKNPKSPLFVSAGGAGAGKTYGFREVVAEDLSLPELEPGDDPNNTDWAWVMLNDDAASDKAALQETLAKYNGTFMGSDGREYPHILFFDDADKLLTTKSKDLVALMKKINDTNPKNRTFTNPKTGKTEVWKGKIIITTNKDLAKLSENDDTQAVLTRAAKSDIHFTRNETMELLADRYATMALKKAQPVLDELGLTEEEDAQLRQDVFDYMLRKSTEADPLKFSPRTFESIIEQYADKWKNGGKPRKTGKGTIGTDVPWEIAAESLLKAEDNDIEKAHDYDESMYSKHAMIDRKKNLEEFMEHAKKNGTYDKFFSQEAQDLILFGPSDDEEKKDKKPEKKSKKKAAKKVEEKEDETKKGFDNEMSLDEAESILFG